MANGAKANGRPRQVVVLIRGSENETEELTKPQPHTRKPSFKNKYPGVGKTTVAYAIANSLQYCLVCKDDVREAALRHDAQVINDMRAIFGEESSKIQVDSNDMTYEAMFAVGLTQLRVGSPGIVLESPLGRVALGNRALQITRDAQALCVLVDCFAERSIWEERLAMRENKKNEFRPSKADQIENSYTDIHYKIDCDAHVRIDCGLPPEENRKIVEGVINQLLEEER